MKNSVKEAASRSSAEGSSRHINIRQSPVNSMALLKYACALVVLLHVWSTVTGVDGFLIPHRKDEVPDDLVAQQLTEGRTSDRLHDVKKGKKGVAISLTNILVGDESSDGRPHVVISGSMWPNRAPGVASGQCNVTDEKVDCASYGIERDECLSRGCCYTEIRDGPAPWCYLPETSLVSQCRGREESRLQCGFYNIRRDECESLGCCWRPTSTPGTPWCYHADVASVQPDAGPGDEPQQPSAPVPHRCGVTPVEPNVNLRIVGGVDALPHSWPWMVSLQMAGEHLCGGSLINNRWVLTAAHCKPIFESLNDSSVVIGAHDLSLPDPLFTQRIGVAKIIINEKYQQQENSVTNDFMLIKLARPVVFNDAVLPVCLPKPFRKLEVGTRCWSTGWGTAEHGIKSEVKLLNQVNLPLIDNEICNQPEWYDGEIDDTMICAGYQEGGKDSCQGDSGGPLVCNEDGRWILYGVVSWGDGCGQANKPGLYGRTSAYLKWITRQIKENSD